MKELARELKTIRNKKIALQIPEGLKHRAREIIDLLERQGNEVYLFIDPCYGACDLRDREAAELGVDLLIHVGHAPFPIKTKIPVKFIELRLPANVGAMHKALEGLPKVALCATVQYIDALKELSKLPNVVVGKGVRTAYSGQILGCDAGACRVDADINVIIADGLFHAIAAYLETKRRTFLLYPDGRLEDVTERCKEFLKRRKGLLLRAYEAKHWAVVISTKPGQFFPQLAREIARRAKLAGKDAKLLVCDYFRPEYVEGMPFDVYIFTGCPRVALDDWKLFKKPILTIQEAFQVLKWLKV